MCINCYQLIELFLFFFGGNNTWPNYYRLMKFNFWVTTLLLMIKWPPLRELQINKQPRVLLLLFLIPRLVDFSHSFIRIIFQSIIKPIFPNQAQIQARTQAQDQAPIYFDFWSDLISESFSHDNTIVVG